MSSSPEGLKRPRHKHAGKGCCCSMGGLCAKLHTEAEEQGILPLNHSGFVVRIPDDEPRRSRWLYHLKISSVALVKEPRVSLLHIPEALWPLGSQHLVKYTDKQMKGPGGKAWFEEADRVPSPWRKQRGWKGSARPFMVVSCVPKQHLIAWIRQKRAVPGHVGGTVARMQRGLQRRLKTGKRRCRSGSNWWGFDPERLKRNLWC